MPSPARPRNHVPGRRAYREAEFARTICCEPPEPFCFIMHIHLFPVHVNNVCPTPPHRRCGHRKFLFCSSDSWIVIDVSLFPSIALCDDKMAPRTEYYDGLKTLVKPKRTTVLIKYDSDTNAQGNCQGHRNAGSYPSLQRFYHFHDVAPQLRIQS